MRALIQRVTGAEVRIEGNSVGRIGPGMVVLACAMQGDGEDNARALAQKIARLRIFADDRGKTNLSIQDVGGAVLAVSQFTLAADTARGNRPGFSAAAPPDEGRRLFDLFVHELAAQGLPVETGVFGADMQLTLTNDGPFTIWLER